MESATFVETGRHQVVVSPETLRSADAANNPRTSSEDELGVFKRPKRTDSPLESLPPPITPLSRNPSTASRLSLLFRSASSSSASKPLPMAPSSALSDLQAALARETALRIAAEKKAKEVQDEIEDLSATLFEQANEMVATERKRNAELSERVRLLEERDRDRGRRLEMIEKAMARIDRVRVLLDK